MVKARDTLATVVATAALVQAGAMGVVLEVIPVMVEAAMETMELVVVVLVVLYIVLHTVVLQVAEPALGDKALLESPQVLVLEKVDPEEKVGILVKILSGAMGARGEKVEIMEEVQADPVVEHHGTISIMSAEEVVSVLYGVQDELSQILRQEICNDGIL